MFPKQNFSFGSKSVHMYACTGKTTTVIKLLGISDKSKSCLLTYEDVF